MKRSFEKQNASAAANRIKMGVQPFNRDCIALAFGSDAKHAPAEKRVADGQLLAGSGALVFEGEALDMPLWH